MATRFAKTVQAHETGEYQFVKVIRGLFLYIYQKCSTADTHVTHAAFACHSVCRFHTKMIAAHWGRKFLHMSSLLKTQKPDNFVANFSDNHIQYSVLQKDLSFLGKPFFAERLNPFTRGKAQHGHTQDKSCLAKATEHNCLNLKFICAFTVQGRKGNFVLQRTDRLPEFYTQANQPFVQLNTSN